MDQVKLKTLNIEEMYIVLINHEEQYSLWPSYKPVPLGWKKVGQEQTKEKCLAYIDEVWTDMRSLSLRKKMTKIAEIKVKYNIYISYGIAC